jgi:hypothetical protein
MEIEFGGTQQQAAAIPAMEMRVRASDLIAIG